MMKNHNLAKAIQQCAWRQFRTMLEYKSERNGKNILVIGRFKPSSKICSKCGYRKKGLTLKVRSWVCPNCQTSHDRDINAAINIRDMALHTHGFVKD